MMYTLVVYDRAAGRLVDERTFERRADAMGARFAAERSHRGSKGNIEVVVLAARSRDDLIRTHSRYFYSLRELADRSA
jgi:hypothetical protein